MASSNGARGDTVFDDLIEALRADITALRSDVSSLKDDSVALGKAGVQRATDQVEEGYEHASKKAKKYAARAEKEVERGAESLRDTVSENPVMSLSAALALGFVLGRGLLRK